MSSVQLYPTTPRARRRTILLDVAVLLGVVVFGWAGMKVHDGVAELAGLGRGLQDAGSAVQDTGNTVGGALRDGFGGAGGAVGGAPVIGGTLEAALRGAGDDAGRTVEQAGADSGGKVVAAGRDGERRAYGLANLLGWLTFLLPAGLLLARVGPTRVRGVLGWTAAARVFGAAGAPPGAVPPPAGAVPPAPGAVPPPPGARAADPTDTAWSGLAADIAANPDHPDARQAHKRAGSAAGAADRRRVLAARAMSTLPYRDLLRHSSDPVGDLLAGRHDPLLAALAEADGVDARPALASAA